MKDRFEALPHPLRKLILLRSAVSGLSVLTFLGVLCYSYKWEFILLCLAISCVLVVGTWKIFYRCTEQMYVTVQGVCTEIHSTWFHKYVKSVTITDGSSTIKIMGTQSPLHTLRVGDSVRAYIAENVPVYDSDGCKVICSCMAIIKEGI